MVKLILTYCLTLVSCWTIAQTVETYNVVGKVISTNTGDPIPNGIISVSKKVRFVCDKHGKFSIPKLSNGEYKLSFSAFGYSSQDTIIYISNEDIQNFTWRIITDCNQYSNEKALKDINAKTPLILLQSGIASTFYENDKNFEEKFQISFHDFGCIPGDRSDCLIEYNKTIFDHLDKVYGKEWRKEIRKDAIGL